MARALKANLFEVPGHDGLAIAEVGCQNPKLALSVGNSSSFSEAKPFGDWIKSNGMTLEQLRNDRTEMRARHKSTPAAPSGSVMSHRGIQLMTIHWHCTRRLHTENKSINFTP